MQDQRDLELAKLQDDLSLLKQHAKHLVSLLGRRLANLGERVAALEESSCLLQEIRQIKDTRFPRQAMKLPLFPEQFTIETNFGANCGCRQWEEAEESRFRARIKSMRKMSAVGAGASMVDNRTKWG
jgi:hypothetical protein